MKSRLFSIVLTLALVLTIGSGVLAWEGTIKVWDFPRPEPVTEWYQEIFAEFEEAHPGVKIEYTKLSWGKGNQSLDIAVASKDWPDLGGSAYRMPYVVQGAIEPIDEFLTPEDRADYGEGFLKALTYKGKIYGWPWYSVSYALILNKDIFEERGVPIPEDNSWTYEEFLEAARELTFDRDGDGEIDVYGIGFPIEPNYYSGWGFFYSDGGQFLSDDGQEIVLDEDENFKALQRLWDLVHVHKVAPPEIGGVDSNTVNNWYNEGRIAMIPEGAWKIKAMDRENAKPEEEREVTYNYAVVRFPIGLSGKSHLSGAGIGSWVVFKQNDPEKKKVVMELARLITSSESQKFAVKEIGAFPSRKSASGIWEGHEAMANFAEAVPDTIFPPVYSHPAWQQIDEKIMKELQLAFLGEKDLKQAIKDAERQSQRFLRF